VSEIFVSYSRSTEPQAVRIDEALRALGYSVWRDDRLLPHRPYLEDTQARLEEAKAVLVLWSKEAAKSQWVRSEANQARARNKIVQASLDGALPPMPFDQIQCARLQGWDGDPANREWQSILSALGELVPRKGRRRKTDPRPSETVAAARGAPATRRMRWLLPVAALAVLVVTAAGVVLLWRQFAPARPDAGSARVAVLPFDATGSGADGQRFATGLFDEILSVLSANQAQVVSRTETVSLRAPDATAIRRLGAALLLDGTIEDTGGRIKARVHLDATATSTILWSEDFERPVSEAEPLEAEVAAKAATMAAYAQQAKAAGLSNAVVGEYISAIEHTRFDWTGGMPAAEPILRRVVQQAPRFARGHSDLAGTLAMQSLIPGAPRAAEQRAEAVREARAAQALDPSAADPYVVLAILRPVTDREERLALLRRAMAVDPNSPIAAVIAGAELSHAGQLTAAAVTSRRAVALDPLWPGSNASLGLRLLESGRESEGLATFDRMARLWPAHDATRLGRLTAKMFYGDPDGALALLSDTKSLPDGLDARAVALHRTFLDALAPGHAAERSRAAAELLAGVRAGALDPAMAMVMLARLGDIDGAFAAAGRYADHASDYAVWFDGPAFLFMPATAPLRRDPRFWPLAARLGLAQYWRASGQWPDFCSEPGLPYDCKAEAAKVAGKP
jgi:adenylate cyclase